MSATTSTWEVVCSRHGVVWSGLSRALARRRAKDHKARDRRLYSPVANNRLSVTTRDRDPAVLAAGRDRLRALANRAAVAKDWVKNWRRLWERLAVEMARPDALVAWDSVEACATAFPPEKMADLLELSRVAYRIERPRSRGENLWIYANSVGRNSAGPHRGRADVLCRFCRVKLLAMQEMGSGNGLLIDEKVRAHTERCAIGFLAGLPPVTILADGTVEALPCEPDSGSVP